MTLQRAIDIFKKKCPTKQPIGYWIDETNVVFNIKPEYGKGYDEICQYVVFENGNVMPTNPLRSPVILEKPMKRL